MTADSSSGSTKAKWHSDRRHPRFPVDIPVGVAFQRKGAKMECSGRVSELSESGMAVYVFTELAIGDRLAVAITLPYTREMTHLDVVVRNRTGFRFGLEFKEPTTHQRRLIARTCSALSGM